MRKILALAVSIVVAASFSGCSKKSASTAADDQKAATNVTIAVVEEGEISDSVTYTGEVKALENASISAKMSGNVKTVYKEIGDYVNEGDILLKLDDTDVRVQYNQAKAMYNQALAQYNSVTNGTAQQSKLQLETALNTAKIEYNNALTNYNNQKVLYDNGAISKSAYDVALTRFENAKLNLDSAQKNYDLTVNVVIDESKATAKAALDGAAAQLESAQNALDNTSVRATISGYIASRNVNKGQMVSGGVELFSVKSDGAAQVHINVTETVIPYITVGAKAYVSVKAINEDKLEAVVTNVSTVKNAQTGMYGVIIRITDEKEKLSDGMFADVMVTLNESAKTKIIPAAALLEDDDQTKYVYIAEGNTAKRVNVETGIITDESVEVVSGLNTGDKVIVKGKEYISEDNNAVNIVD